MKNFLLIILSLFTTNCFAQTEANSWYLDDYSGISRNVGIGQAFTDHIEMSGKFISAVIRYGVKEDMSYYINRDLVWPMLRTIPNDTHASLIRTFNIDPVTLLSINKKAVTREKISSLRLDGKITVVSLLNDNIQLTRTLFPSTELPVFCEKYEIANLSGLNALVEVPEIKNVVRTLSSQGTEGSYALEVKTQNHGTVDLSPGESYVFFLSISGRREGEMPEIFDVAGELIRRDSLIRFFNDRLILETPDPILNQMFAFAKIRAAESIYQTKGGPMHGPGGLRYYAALWANDQAEYVNPFFPYLGYDYGIESAMNSYQHFARFMNTEYKPIPSSIIAEGTDIWNGAGDRGDGAMIAYGASRFALSLGDREKAMELWPLIEWCLEYNRRKLNKHGVVSSDSDELEGRFPAGTANLNTSSLYYDALISAAYLASDLGKGKQLAGKYREQAKTLRDNILRAWICTPLTVGIFDRKAGTINALFSPDLWTVDGLASQSGDKTYWDRSTLYGLRGVFAAGDREQALRYLKYYSKRRLLGEHVPYAVEAFPEGNQRHLSAESGLYCRIFTEGVFGIRPVSLNSFTLTPQLPEEWSGMKMRNISGFNREFDIEVTREDEKIRIKVISENNTFFNKLSDNGAEVTVSF